MSLLFFRPTFQYGFNQPYQDYWMRRPRNFNLFDDDFLETNLIPIQHEHPDCREINPKTKERFHREKIPQLFGSKSDYEDSGPRNQQHHPPHKRQKEDDFEEIIPIEVIHQETDENENLNEHLLPVSESEDSPLLSENVDHQEPKTEENSDGTDISMPTNVSENQLRSTNSVGQLSLNEEKDIDINSSFDKATTKIVDETSNIVEKALNEINSVMTEVEKLESDVETFEGTSKDKAYLRLEHELTTKLLTLDKVNAIGTPQEDDVRSKRKAAVNHIQSIFDKLESKLL